jgi:hypothetical protein
MDSNCQRTLQEGLLTVILFNQLLQLYALNSADNDISGALPMEKQEQQQSIQQIDLVVITQQCYDLNRVLSQVNSSQRPATHKRHHKQRWIFGDGRRPNSLLTTSTNPTNHCIQWSDTMTSQRSGVPLCVTVLEYWSTSPNHEVCYLYKYFFMVESRHLGVPQYSSTPVLYYRYY